MGAVVKDSHIKFNGISYFRGNATAVRLGSYGRKKIPLFSMNYLEVDGNLSITATIEPAVVADIDTTSSSKGDATINLSVIGGAYAGNATGAWEAFQSHKLKLVQFCLTLSQVKSLVAASGGAMDCLKDNKNSGRVSYQVWVVMEATEASKFTGSVTLSAKFTVNGITITAKSTTSSGTTSTVTLSANSTYAYLLAKPKWSGSSVSSFTTDQWSAS